MKDLIGHSAVLFRIVESLINIGEGVFIALLVAIIVFLFTNSSMGITLIAKIKGEINEEELEYEKAKVYSDDQKAEKERLKKVSSKLYEDPKKFDVNTFFTIKSSDLKNLDMIRFYIKEKIDGEYICFDISTEFLLKYTPPEYVKEGEDTNIQVYIRRLRGQKEFTIERLGKSVDSVPVSEYMKINETN